VADNDYAVGLLVEKIANSIYANNTLIFVVEDDAQDGGDHIDSHRTTAYVAGAYVKNGVVPTAYNTLDFLRTMEEVLGLQPMNLNDALATPMTDIFNTTPSTWTFTAILRRFFTVRSCRFPLPRCHATIRRRTWPTGRGSPREWTSPMRDLVDGGHFNRIL